MSKCGIPYVVDEDGNPGQAWHVVRGCKEKSRGCAGCYARRLAATRFGKLPQYDGLASLSTAGYRWTGEARLFPEELAQPLRRRKLTTWFVVDMGDLFHEQVPDGFLLRVFEIMAMAREQRFLLLTKRPERLAVWLARWADLTGEPLELQLVRGPEATRKAHPSPRGQMFAEYLEHLGPKPDGAAYPTFDWLEGMRRWPARWYLPNVWIGVSAEGRRELEERVPQLLRLPIDCAGFWLSAEPQIEDLGDVSEYLVPTPVYDLCLPSCREGRKADYPEGFGGSWCRPSCGYARPALSFVVQGCESGAGARPFDVAWAISLHEQIQQAGSVGYRCYFYKQAPGPRGKVDKLPTLYGRTWREVPWLRK